MPRHSSGASPLTRERLERAAWAEANGLPAGSAASADAIAKFEAMEQARKFAEARAAADEDEWREEELRLQEAEEERRKAREKAAAWVEDDEDGDDEFLVDVERKLSSLTRGQGGGAGGGGGGSGTADAATEEDAISEAVMELLERDGNRTCFDCDAALVGADLHPPTDATLWFSVSHGVLLCAACGRLHQGLGAHCSVVKALGGGEGSGGLTGTKAVTPRVEEDAAAVSTNSAASTSTSTTTSSSPALELLSDLDALFAGGNRAFSTYLAEEMGVPRHVWLALSLDDRYQTPAAELYARRLKAFMRGEEILPSDLHVHLQTSSSSSSAQRFSPHPHSAITSGGDDALSCDDATTTSNASFVMDV